MINWLLCRFVKNYEDTRNQTVRSAYVSVASYVGIGCNLLLSAAKFLIGLFSGSVAVTADAANNLSDAGGVIVSLVSMHFAQKPEDKDHPFGHGRMEYIGALAVGVLILLMGLELFKEGISNIIHPSAPDFSILSWVLLLAGIAVKGWMYFFYGKLGRAVDSQSLQAASKDSVNDVLASSGILLGMLLYLIFRLPLDGYMGALVALVVLRTGFQVCKDTVDRLLGGMPNKEMGERLTEKLLSYEGILGVHDLVVHDYGPGRCIASVHAEVSAKSDIVKIHEMIDHAEREISQEMNIPIVIHMDPIVTDDQETNETRTQMEAFLKSVDERLRLHDFRRVPGEKQINLIFDVLLPADYKESRELEQRIEAYAREIDSRFVCVLNFDVDYYQ